MLHRTKVNIGFIVSYYLVRTISLRNSHLGYDRFISYLFSHFIFRIWDEVIIKSGKEFNLHTIKSKLHYTFDEKTQQLHKTFWHLGEEDDEEEEDEGVFHEAGGEQDINIEDYDFELPWHSM